PREDGATVPQTTTTRRRRRDEDEKPREDDMDRTLIVPGLHGSGPDHWQTWFERQLSDCIRVTQSDWTDPELRASSATLPRELGRRARYAPPFGSRPSREQLRP